MLEERLLEVQQSSISPTLASTASCLTSLLVNTKLDMFKLTSFCAEDTETRRAMGRSVSGEIVLFES